jgi:hypothetical protein
MAQRLMNDYVYLTTSAMNNLLITTVFVQEIIQSGTHKKKESAAEALSVNSRADYCSDDASVLHAGQVPFGRTIA